MLNKEQILKIAQKKGLVKTRDFLADFNVSRQYISNLISQLVEEKKLVKIGSTRSAKYATPGYLELHPDELPTRFHKKLINTGLEEHKVLDDIERHFGPYAFLPENIKSIFAYSFSEMLNNAIEHSESKKINITVDISNDELVFAVDDFGIGVFRNIMQKRKLKDELEAIQDLMKGKTTTKPKLHSGEGIFFTSKIGDEFILDSYGYQLVINNKIDDIFVKKVQGQKQGTKVIFRLDTATNRHLNDVFKEYTDVIDSDYGFDKTEIRVKLYLNSGVHISRSQARRVLSDLEKFRVIIMDYDKVPMIGQAFADEIYRVFKNKYPQIVIKNENMNEAVKFMVERAINEAKKSL
ncbi:MAG: DUF4325 domain-containing protein [Patescibacteria group bacterium]